VTVGTDLAATRRTRTAHGLLDAPLRVYHQHLLQPIPTHWHDFYEIAFVLAGTGRHTVNGREARLRPGALVGLTPADFHALAPHPNAGLEMIDVIFPAELLDAEVQQLLLAASWPAQIMLSGEDRRRLELDLRRLWSEEESALPGREAAARATLQRVLIDLIRAAGNTPAASRMVTDAPVRAALLYLHHRFRQPISLTDVAAQAHLSPHYFSQRFREATGVTFVRYRQELRLSFAHTLLAVSELPVTDVSYAAGFNTLSHFERAFRARYHRAPRDVRAARTAGQHRLPDLGRGRARSRRPRGDDLD
jgi:AraC-like DNA-binding protein/mannose-6-phosphate isomerase-like protein (cupin superfamily)